MFFCDGKSLIRSKTFSEAKEQPKMSLKIKVRARFTDYALTLTLVGNVDYWPGWFI